jgi:hypothetical protein
MSENKNKSGNKQFLLISFGILCLVCLITFIPYCNSIKTNFSAGKNAASYVSVLMHFKDWAIAFERYRQQNGEFPSSNSIQELKIILSPFHDSEFSLRTQDPWKAPYVIESSKNQYTITCKGDDNVGDHGFKGALDHQTYKDSTTMRNGVFVQYKKSSLRTVQEFEEEINAIKHPEKHTTDNDT